MINQRALLEQRYHLQFPDSFSAFWDFARPHSSLLDDVFGGLHMGMALTPSKLVGPFAHLNASQPVAGDPLWDARNDDDPRSSS